MQDKPWDARLAAYLVTPFIDSAFPPNHFTTLRLVVGLAGAFLFAYGAYPNTAASLIIASNFIDHADGELARMSDKTSHFGHLYDLAADALVTILLFVGIGIGLSERPDDGGSNFAPIVMGAIAGIAVAIIFQLRNHMESVSGKAAVTQVSFAGFEAEDILYLLPLVTISGVLSQFLLAAAIGAPIAAMAVAIHFLSWRRQRT